MDAMNCIAYRVQSVSSWLEGGIGWDGLRFASHASVGNNRNNSWNRPENSINICVFN